MNPVHTFAGNPFDRAEAQRRDAEWLAAIPDAPTSRMLLFSELRVLLRDGDPPRLEWIPTSDRKALGSVPPPVLLGLADGVAHFALDVSECDDALGALGRDDACRFEDCRAAATAMGNDDMGIVAQARSQLAWHKSHRFCSTCGSPSTMRRGGHVRVCDRCGAEHFPRTDPVAIMLITRDERCLLGQPKGPLVRTGIYSALAGFIDQGESIEEAVRREVMEEAGIRVGAVRYHSSQPWPFPSSLMIGCHGEASSEEIRIDAGEMHDVQWFSRNDARAALARESSVVKVPGPMAIAHHLIRAWAEGGVDL